MRGNGLPKDIIEGQTEGKRGPRRRRIQLTDELEQGRKEYEVSGGKTTS